MTPDEQDWDARCKQCGRCCFEKLLGKRGRIIYTDIPCRYLDVATRRCKVFERRFAINPSCVKLTPEILPRLNWLPADCGYRDPQTPGSESQPRRPLPSARPRKK